MRSEREIKTLFNLNCYQHILSDLFHKNYIIHYVIDYLRKKRYLIFFYIEITFNNRIAHLKKLFHFITLGRSVLYLKYLLCNKKRNKIKNRSIFILDDFFTFAF